MNGTDLEKAQHYLDKGDFNAASSEFKKILDKNPQDIKALLGLGWTFGHLGLLDDALQVFQEALKFDTDNPKVYYGISWVYHQKKAWREAEVYGCKAVSLAPNEAVYHWGLAVNATKSKDKNAMETILVHLEAAYRLDPTIFDKRARKELWYYRIFTGLDKVIRLVFWALSMTMFLIVIDHSRYVLKLSIALLIFLSASVYYLIRHHYRRAIWAFILGLLWGGVTYAIAQWFFFG
jgi:tetratricopeptide (TPR) repeat protein